MIDLLNSVPHDSVVGAVIAVVTFVLGHLNGKRKSRKNDRGTVKK